MRESHCFNKAVRIKIARLWVHKYAKMEGKTLFKKTIFKVKCVHYNYFNLITTI